MSLLRAVREGYNSGVITRPEVDEVILKSAVAESTYTDAAMVELVQSVYKVQEAFDVADVMGEYAVIEGTMDAEAVLEGMVTSSLEKIKQAFQTFWKKITAFFAEVKKAIKAFFSRGEKFVKEYETELKKKDTKEFKFMGFPYDVDGGDSKIEAVSDACGKEVNRVLSASDKTVAELKDAFSSTTGDDARTVDNSVTIHEKIAGGKLDDSSEYIEKVIKGITGLGAADISEMKEKITEAYRGGEEAAIEIQNFDKGKNVGGMCDYVKSNAKTISAIEKEQKKFDADLNAIIKMVDSFANKKETQGETYKVASTMSGMLTKVLNLRKSAVDIQIAMHKEVAGAYDNYLHKLLGYKKKEGVGESFNEPVATGVSSLLEAAQGYI